MKQRERVGGADPIAVVVKEVHVKRGDIELISKSTGVRIRLREFQERLVESFCSDTDRFVGLEAPTGAGKTFTLLAPFIANILCGKSYQGAVGIYPTKPLVNDQFVSLRNTLDNLGERIETIKGAEGFDIAVKYQVKLRIVHKQTERSAVGTIGLVRLTREALDRIGEHLRQQRGELRRFDLLDVIRRVLIDADYLIAVTVPEYPYMMLSSTYRSVADSYKIIELALDGNFVYRIAGMIESASEEELYKVVLDVRKSIEEAFPPKVYERERLNIYSALFSEVLFLDEFHTWTIYEKPTVIALVLLHYLESLYTARPASYRVVFSSATPQSDIYDILKRLGIGEVKVIRAEPVQPSLDSDKVKSRTLVEFVPVLTEPLSGVIAWFKVEDEIPRIVEKYSNTIANSSRAIVFARRNAVVEEAAEVFNKCTGRTPAVVTGVRTKFPGKELLEERKSSGELFVFGNYSIEFGVDLKSIQFGLLHGVSLGELIQRFGRIGRGDVDEAHVIIPIPLGYVNIIKSRVGRIGREVDYATFIDILSEVMPQRLGIEVFGTEYIMGHKVGKLRLYAPLASYILNQIYMLEYHKELQRLCKTFKGIIEKLNITDIFSWLRKVSKTPEVLIPLASFRISYTMPYVRLVEKEQGKADVEDSASLSTLLGNYDVEYAKGKITIRGVSKKPLLKVFSLHCSYSPEGIYDTVIPSDLLLNILSNAISGNSVLIKILKERSIPLYIAPIGVDAEVFAAYGYAVKFELPTGKAFYAFIL